MLGDPVDVAARLEELNKGYGTKVLVSGNTVDALQETYPLVRISDVAIRGKREPVRIYSAGHGRGAIASVRHRTIAGASTMDRTENSMATCEGVGDRYFAQQHPQRMMVRRGQISDDFDQINQFQLYVLQQITGAPNAPWQPEIGHSSTRSSAMLSCACIWSRCCWRCRSTGAISRPSDMFLRAVNFVVHSAPIYKDVNSISWQFPLSALMNSG